MLEVLVTLAILAVVAGIAGIAVRRSVRTNEARNGIRRVLFAVDEARSAALLLASAAGTQRVDSIGTNCPTQMDAHNGTSPPWGRSAMVIETGYGSCTVSPCDRITYVALVQRDSTVSPPTYAIGCKSIELTTGENTSVSTTNSEIIHGLRIDTTHTIMTSPSAGTYFISFDSRGLINNLPAGNNAGKIGINLTDTGVLDALLILASGATCRDASPSSTSAPFVCASTN